MKLDSEYSAICFISESWNFEKSFIAVRISLDSEKRDLKSSSALRLRVQFVLQVPLRNFLSTLMLVYYELLFVKDHQFDPMN